MKIVILLLVAVGAYGQISPPPTNAPSGAAGGNLSGTYPNPVVAKINGTTVTTNATANQVALTTAAAVTAWTSIPACLDSAGQHLNFNTTTHTFSCGTSGGGTPASPVNSVQYDNAGAFGGDANLVYIPTGLSTPSAPTVATHGTAGTNNYGYEIRALNAVGTSLPSSEATIATGNATLNNTNWNDVTTPAVTGSSSCNVYRSTTDGTPATYGLIGNVACGAVLADKGLAGGGALPTASGTSAGIVSASAVRGGPQTGFVGQAQEAYINATANGFNQLNPGVNAASLGGVIQAGNALVGSSLFATTGGAFSTNTAGAIFQMTGAEGDAYATGSGGVGMIFGVAGYAQINDGATTDIASLKAWAPSVSSPGTATDAAGLLIDDTSICGATNCWNILSRGAPTKNKIEGTIQVSAAAFATLTACGAGLEGTMKPVSDSSTATWGATITGGGANHVLGYCNGTNWTVAAK